MWTWKQKPFIAAKLFAAYQVIPTMKLTLPWIGGSIKYIPEDRKRVRNKLNEDIQKGVERWEDEYRFECADGQYKFFSTQELFYIAMENRYAFSGRSGT